MVPSCPRAGFGSTKVPVTLIEPVYKEVIVVYNGESTILAPNGLPLLVLEDSDWPEATDALEDNASPDDNDTLGGIEERESCPLGTRTSIVVVASESAAFKIVLVLTTWPAHSDVNVTYLRTIVFVIVENAVTTVLNKVGAFPIVMGISNGNGVSVVFEVI